MSKEARKRAAEVSPAIAEKIKELAELIAAERFGAQGVPKEITFSEIEEIGHQAGRALAAEVDRNLVANHSDHFDYQQVCPQCGRLCAGQSHRRELLTRDGPVGLAETACYCVDCRRSFFPQRVPLRLDGRAYSPLVLEQIVTAGVAVKSYEAAAILLKKLAEVEVSTRHVNNLTTMVGEELAETVCRQTEAYRDQPLPRKPTEPEMPIGLAGVACDGGRMQTREAGCGRGVHDAHWRETKNAGFFA